jgi:hypothetical protein
MKKKQLEDSVILQIISKQYGRNRFRERELMKAAKLPVRPFQVLKRLEKSRLLGSERKMDVGYRNPRGSRLFWLTPIGESALQAFVKPKPSASFHPPRETPKVLTREAVAPPKGEVTLTPNQIGEGVVAKILEFGDKLLENRETIGRLKEDFRKEKALSESRARTLLQTVEERDKLKKAVVNREQQIEALKLVIVAKDGQIELLKKKTRSSKERLIPASKVLGHVQRGKGVA